MHGYGHTIHQMTLDGGWLTFLFLLFLCLVAGFFLWFFQEFFLWDASFDIADRKSVFCVSVNSLSSF